jgi:hypothetical protein
MLIDCALTCIQLEGLAAFEHGSPDLWALCVQHGGHMDPLASRHLPDPLKHSGMPLMVAVAEVEARHVEPCVQQLTQPLLTPAGGAQRAHNLGLAGCCDTCCDKLQGHLAGGG